MSTTSQSIETKQARLEYLQEAKPYAFSIGQVLTLEEISAKLDLYEEQINLEQELIFGCPANFKVR